MIRVKALLSLAICWAFSANTYAEWQSLDQAAEADKQQANASQNQATSSQPAQGMSTAAQQELLQYLDELRSEVQELRAMVEEQAFQIRTMQAEQRDRYLDIDRRLNAVHSGAGSAGSQGQNASSSTKPLGQRDAYAEATKLVRDRDYPAAVQALKQFIADYPDTGLTPNAHYWLGEVYLVLPDFDQARSAFELVVNQYPEHRKVPDARLKLGVTYQKMGDSEQAKRVWENIVKDYQGKNATIVRLAQNYLRNL